MIGKLFMRSVPLWRKNPITARNTWHSVFSQSPFIPRGPWSVNRWTHRRGGGRRRGKRAGARAKCEPRAPLTTPPPLPSQNRPPDQREPVSTPSSSSSRVSVKLGLLNARSVKEKTSVLSDFISNQDLDFFAITESWQVPEDLSALIELCPVGWKFHCTPRCGKTGGGVALMYKDNYTCSMLNCPTFSSFEAQLVKVGSADPLLVIIIYRPTDSRVFKGTKNFISQFSTFLTDIIPSHDRVLILGDFNIHVDNPIRAFENTHQVFPAFTAAKNTAGEKPSSDPEELTIMFNSTCQSILDTIAPLTLKKPKPAATPWLNDTTRAQRRVWRQAERRWKKDRLQILLEMLRDSQQTYQRVVKSERAKYFASVIANNSHNPRVLFQTINSVAYPSPTAIQDPSPTKCEEFLSFFCEKVINIRRNIPPPTQDLATTLGCASNLPSFDPISMSSLSEMASSLKPASST
ncbi:hypothetical protein AAFF_G00069280 [Aldrovandia affinis]|uniref:Endonuclease/exonuclease/phosphatase domain-containing protein n=1 Tax=Aldrovandia affinis TaxID=143900 RepID=A0AAD7RZ54_9TELE|nr:hypothetical protein AAFF_G00069280 [Aldrovandia affinis]